MSQVGHKWVKSNRARYIMSKFFSFNRAISSDPLSQLPQWCEFCYFFYLLLRNDRQKEFKLHAINVQQHKHIHIFKTAVYLLRYTSKNQLKWTEWKNIKRDWGDVFLHVVLDKNYWVCKSMILKTGVQANQSIQARAKNVPSSSFPIVNTYCDLNFFTRRHDLD